MPYKYLYFLTSSIYRTTNCVCIIKSNNSWTGIFAFQSKKIISVLIHLRNRCCRYRRIAAGNFYRIYFIWCIFIPWRIIYFKSSYWNFLIGIFFYMCKIFFVLLIITIYIWKASHWFWIFLINFKYRIRTIHLFSTYICVKIYLFFPIVISTTFYSFHC